MEFNEVIGRRRTIRDFQNKEIPLNIIEYAIANGFKAPTYNHLRAWDFIIINNLATKKQLIETENLEKVPEIPVETRFIASQSSNASQPSISVASLLPSPVASIVPTPVAPPQFEDDDAILKEMYLEAIPKQKRMILDAPIVIVVVFKPKTRVDVARTIYDLNCLASVWTCIENFLLSLAEHDVYGVTYIPQQIDSLKRKLNIPDELEIAAIIPIGYKADDAKTVKQKPIDIHERIHFNKW